MSTMVISVVAAVCVLVLAALALSALIRRRYIEAAIEACAAIGGIYTLVQVMRLTSAWIAFGADESAARTIVLFVVLVVSAILGAAAQEYWRTSAWSFANTLKAVVVTPITILPLVELSEHAQAGVEGALLVALLAFQNGFFWRTILEKQGRGLSEDRG